MMIKFLGTVGFHLHSFFISERYILCFYILRRLNTVKDFVTTFQSLTLHGVNFLL